jgi:hypothetical protein
MTGEIVPYGWQALQSLNNQPLVRHWGLSSRAFRTAHRSGDNLVTIQSLVTIENEQKLAQDRPISPFGRA